MGKTKGKNGFYFYLLHTQSVLKREGKNYGLNNSELQTIAGDKWREFSAEERKPFEDRAKAAKGATHNAIEISPKTYAQRTNENSFDKIVVSSESQQRDESSGREIYLDQMVKSCVNACKTKDELMSNFSFFIVATNVMIKTDSNEYYPLEIGITQYNIKDGIQYTYHQFIDAGKVPLGYQFAAQDFAKETHKIPLDNFLIASNNYPKIVEEILEILDKSRLTNENTQKPTPMMVYCLEDQMDQNRGVFEWLAKKYRQVVPHFQWDLEIMDLVNLLFHITNHQKVNQRINPAKGEDLLTSSAFDYSPNTNCDFHEEQDNRFCAEGLSKRLCYMLSQALCPIFGINPTANHLPQSRTNVIAETYRPVFHDIKPLRPNRFVSNPDNDWTPLPSQSQPRPESSQSRPQSRQSETINRLGIGRGRGVTSRYGTDSSRSERR